MKIRNVTFILMLGGLILFSMCKKDIDKPSTPPPNGGGGVDTTGNGNGNRPQLISFSPEAGPIGDTVTITGVNFTGNPNTLKVSFGNNLTTVIGVSTSTSNNVKNIVIKV